MTNKLGIGVEATFDTKAVEQGAKKIEQTLQEAGKVQINPVSPQAIKQVDVLTQKMQQLLKVDGELRRRVKATGQIGMNYADIDWGAMYPDAPSRKRKMATVNEYLGLPNHAAVPGGPAAPPGPTAQPAARPPGGFAAGAMGIAQSGLRAAGPVGGVAAGALNTGASAASSGGFMSGIGAGLGGLLGGLLALGVGKIVGGVMEKIGQAEDNNVQYDRLKRTIGDVGVSFEGLKAVFTSGAEKLRVTYGEYGALGMQFARAGNLQASQYTSMHEEVGTGIGLSRSFGLDPAQGVGILGQMRGMGVTSNVQDSRKFALLIGETIGKSGAFSKAEEVFDALGGYATSQTRSSMGAANVSGYAGMYSGMVGSGIAGMDPMGAAGMLSRINASLSAGGAKGEASQFFTAQVGHRMGLDPIQTQILREGGAFASNDEAFGKDSVAARYGIKGPGGSKTFLQGSLEELRAQYGGNKGMLAQATANHLGVNMRQAMGLLSVQPNQMGEMQKYAGDLTKLNAGGIGNLSKVLYGTADDRQSVAQSMLRRNDISQQDKEALTSDRFTKGDPETQKQILSNLVAQHDQERTTGSDIRDSKNALDNIKTSLADKLVPLTLEMRHGIMAIAGAGSGKSSEEIMRGVVEADSKQRAKSIEGRFQPKKSGLVEQQDDLSTKLRTLDPVKLAYTYRDKPEILEKKLQERALVEAELAEVGKRLAAIEKEKGDLLKAENERKTKELGNIATGIEARWKVEDAGGAGGGSGPGTGGSSGGGGSYEGAGGEGGSGGRVGPMDPKKREEAMRFFTGKGWTKEQAAGLVANLGAESGLNEKIVGDGGKAYGIAQWHPDRQAAFSAKYGKDIRQSTYQEQLEFVHHELTQGREQAAGKLLRLAQTGGQSGSVVSKYYERPKYREAEAAKRAAEGERLAKLDVPAPEQLAAKDKEKDALRLKVDPLEVRHVDEKGKEVKLPQFVKMTVGPAAPFGGGKN